jgi:phage terminase large subunit-like protein
VDDEELSPADRFAELPEAERNAIINRLSDDDVKELAFDWEGFWARPKQREPAGDWRYWLILAGRGFGKTRTGGEWIRKRIRQGARQIILAGPTSGDIRDAMIEGESGILAKSPPWDRPEYEPSKMRLTWRSGARALLISADEPDRFRNKQCDTFWLDELGAWRFEDAWNQLLFGFRLGDAYGVTPRGCITTTPRPTPLIKELAKRGQLDPTDVRLVRGKSQENRHNLAKAFVDSIITRYQGTRLGRQELDAEILEDTPGALWARAQIDKLRVKEAPAMRRIVVSIDPSATSGDEADEAGIIVAGLGVDDQGYVLDDVSAILSPDGWGRRSVIAYNDWEGDRIIAEVNNGGEMVELTIRTVAASMKQSVPYRGIHASRGKRTRAEPVAALYEQGRIHHVGAFGALEDELCTHSFLDNEASPNRLDALVWAFTDLMLQRQAGRGGKSGGSREMAGGTGGF